MRQTREDARVEAPQSHTHTGSYYQFCDTYQIPNIVKTAKYPHFARTESTGLELRRRGLPGGLVPAD